MDKMREDKFMLRTIMEPRRTDTREDRSRARPSSVGRSIGNYLSNLASISHTTSLRQFDVKALGELIYEQVNQEPAEIVVIIPLYNYAGYVTQCIESLVKQDISRLSLVVIDDCSTDGGAQVIVSLLEAACDRFSAARMVRHHRNQGLAMTRNSGIVWSVEPFLFMLDADNRIRPPALSRLLEALLSAQAEFAYSQLYLFDGQNEIGNADIWNPPRFRITGNYIDGMALIRREALLGAGGYRVSAVEEGWEDFDLWCRFAGLGYHGVYLPEILCEYRVHNSSMLRTRTDSRLKSLSLEMTLRHSIVLGRDDVPPFVELCPEDLA